MSEMNPNTADLHNQQKRGAHEFEWNYAWIAYYVGIVLMSAIALFYVGYHFVGGALNGLGHTDWRPLLEFFPTPWWLMMLQPILTIGFAYCWYRVGLYAITIMHRYHAHQSFKMYREWLQKLWTALFYSVLQGLLLLWVGWHRNHHARTDTIHDITSPWVYGWWHAQMLVWMRKGFIAPAERRYYIHLLRKNSEFAPSMSMERHYWKIGLFMAFGVPALVCSLWLDPIGGLLIAFPRLAAVYWDTWGINSDMHTKGERMEGAGTATNSTSRIYINRLVGEPNHARHHLYSYSYRHGKNDRGAEVIEFMARKGWVGDLRVAPDLKEGLAPDIKEKLAA